MRDLSPLARSKTDSCPVRLIVAHLSEWPLAHRVSVTTVAMRQRQRKPERPARASGDNSTVDDSRCDRLGGPVIRMYVPSSLTGPRRGGSDATTGIRTKSGAHHHRSDPVLGAIPLLPKGRRPVCRAVTSCPYATDRCVYEALPLRCAHRRLGQEHSKHRRSEASEQKAGKESRLVARRHGCLVSGGSGPCERFLRPRSSDRGIAGKRKNNVRLQHGQAVGDRAQSDQLVPAGSAPAALDPI